MGVSGLCQETPADREFQGRISRNLTGTIAVTIIDGRRRRQESVIKKICKSGVRKPGSSGTRTRSAAFALVGIDDWQDLFRDSKKGQAHIITYIGFHDDWRRRFASDSAAPIFSFFRNP